MMLPLNAWSRTSLPLSVALLLAPTAALAAPDKGDTAFLMLSTVLVLLMTIPGLALFYCGLVRTKNAISMLMQVFTIVCLVCTIWMLYGYSLTFTNGGQFNDWIGGLSKAFLQGVTINSQAATFSNGVYVPEYAYVWFQMTFAAITSALIVGAFAERMKFSALIVLHDPMGDAGLFSDRPHGLVLGGSRCHRQCGARGVANNRSRSERR